MSNNLPGVICVSCNDRIVQFSSFKKFLLVNQEVVNEEIEKESFEPSPNKKRKLDQDSKENLNPSTADKDPLTCKISIPLQQLSKYSENLLRTQQNEVVFEKKFTSISEMFNQCVNKRSQLRRRSNYL